MELRLDNQLQVFNQHPQKTEFSYLDNNPRGKLLLLSNFQRRFLTQIVVRMEDEQG